MAIRHRRVCAVLLPLLLAVAASHAQSGASSATSVGATVPAARSLTGKERLGEKWKDEQRVDNCKVPVERRGARVRPDSCAHVLSN